MPGYRIISSDSHVYEPADLWTTRIEPKFRDRAPHIVPMEDGDWWFVDGEKIVSVFGGAQTGVRFEEPEKLTRKDRFENVRLGGYIPEEHVKDMDTDGVDVNIVYPTVGLMLYLLPDSELLSAAFRAYNDWLAEFCKPFPDRLKGIGMLNLDEVAVGVKELERCAKIGLRGAMITVYPPEGRSYDSAEYDPLWAAAQDLDMPLGLHVATNRGNRPGARASSMVNFDHWVRMSIADMIFGGVFERYPKLQIGSVEMELAWAPHFLERMDYAHTQRAQEDTWYKLKGDMLPSEYFQRNVFVSFQEDALGVRDRHIIGVDNLLWGSDYPHQESTFPRTRQILEEILSDCTEEEKVKIAGGNAARVYRLK